MKHIGERVKTTTSELLAAGVPNTVQCSYFIIITEVPVITN